jgi:hypothetical protein
MANTSSLETVPLPASGGAVQVSFPSYPSTLLVYILYTVPKFDYPISPLHLTYPLFPQSSLVHPPAHLRISNCWSLLSHQLLVYLVFLVQQKRCPTSGDKRDLYLPQS